MEVSQEDGISIHKVNGSAADVGVHVQVPCVRTKSIDSGLDADIEGCHENSMVTTPVPVVTTGTNQWEDEVMPCKAAMCHNVQALVAERLRLSTMQDLNGDATNPRATNCDDTMNTDHYLTYQDLQGHRPHGPLDTVPELSVSERASDQSDEAIESQMDADSQSDSISQTSPEATELTCPSFPEGGGGGAEQIRTATPMTRHLHLADCSGGSNSSLSDHESSPVTQKPPSGRKCRTRNRPACSKQSWLLRLFESKLFDMSIAITYLFNSKEPGVQTYIGVYSLYRLYIDVCHREQSVTGVQSLCRYVSQGALGNWSATIM